MKEIKPFTIITVRDRVFSTRLKAMHYKIRYDINVKLYNPMENPTKSVVQNMLIGEKK
jgi:hypothetical protein